MIIREQTYDWFFSITIVKIICVSIFVGGVATAFFHSDYTATITTYVCISVMVIARFHQQLRRVVFGESALWKNVLLGIGIGIAGDLLLQALPCITEHCLFNKILPNSILLVAFACIVGPFAETIIFNGIVQTAAIRLMGPLAGLVFGSGTFTAAHLQLTPFIIVMGITFAFLRYRRFPLITVILAHVATNAVTYVFGFV